MLKAGMVSDVHFGEHQNNPLFLEMQINWFVNELLPSLIEREIKVLFILGDLFHNKETTNNLVKQRVYNMFKNEFKDITIVVSLGNHDLYYRDSREVHGLHVLRDLPNIKLVEKVTRVKLGTAVLAVVPWMIPSEKERDIASISAIQPDVVMGHFEFTGFSFNRLYPARHGDDASFLQQAVTSVKKVYSGHYHTSSVRDIGGASFRYLGAPFQYTRIDEGEEKGWWVLDLDTLEDEFVPSKFITRFLKISYPFEGTDSELLSIVSGNILEVEVKTADFSGKPFAKFMDKLSAMKPYRSEAKLVGKDDVAENSLSETKTGESDEPKTVLDLIDGYIRTQDWGKNDEYRLTVMAEMNSIYSEASASELA